MYITVHEAGKKSTVEIGCIDCDDGKKPMSEPQAREFTLHKEEQHKLWCSCDNSSGASYVDDNVSKKCRKHHWTCNDCHKIVQIG